MKRYNVRLATSEKPAVWGVYVVFRTKTGKKCTKKRKNKLGALVERVR